MKKTVATTKNGHPVEIHEDRDFYGRIDIDAICKGCRAHVAALNVYEPGRSERFRVTTWAEKHARTCHR
ncbi:hypothetical protein [Streptomyces natalensis]|uniref:Uncharacterized protein n=1 Tax=Streptomyces natalensis ATCC 27448 TaxID=1240678 RepID=A0A0D7CRR1_9ACTN|nr:hypothetical protein [Streptomyces natalensis]KIZ18097.1 hypothetical protein SNA_08700 [Streptomyces natalensis ATCC 27448]